jgi:hypothetical protein
VAEAERAQALQRFAEVRHRQIDAAERRPQLEVRALDVQADARLAGPRADASGQRAPLADEEGDLAVRQRVAAQVLAPGARDRVGVEQPRAHVAWHEQEVEAGDGARRVARDDEGLGRGVPPGAERLDGGLRLVGAGDRLDPGPVAGPRRLVRVQRRPGASRRAATGWCAA